MQQRVRSRSGEEVAARRGKIVGEAIRVVGQRGSNGLTIHEIAKRCGLSNAGLLYHFNSKEELLLASLQELERRETQVLAPIVDAIKQETEQGKPSLENLLKLLHTMVARASANLELVPAYMVLQAESLDKDHAAYASFQRREALVLDLFTTLTTPFVDNPASTARLMLALVDGLNLQWIRSGKTFDIVAEWDRAVRVLLGVAPDFAA